MTISGSPFLGPKLKFLFSHLLGCWKLSGHHPPSAGDALGMRQRCAGDAPGMQWMRRGCWRTVGAPPTGCAGDAPLTRRGCTGDAPKMPRKFRGITWGCAGDAPGDGDAPGNPRNIRVPTHHSLPRMQKDPSIQSLLGKTCQRVSYPRLYQVFL